MDIIVERRTAPSTVANTYPQAPGGKTQPLPPAGIFLQAWHIRQGAGLPLSLIARAPHPLGKTQDTRRPGKIHTVEGPSCRQLWIPSIFPSPSILKIRPVTEVPS